MMRFAVACLVCAFGVASTFAEVQAKPLTAVEKQEMNEISKSNGAVTRKDLSLIFKLDSGKKLELVDKRTCDVYENCEHYIYQGELANGQFYWVDAGFYEGGAVYLISRKTGEKIDVYREPHVSPDGRYIATASDEEAYGDPGVFLWEIKDGVMVSRFRFVPEDYQLFKFVAWQGNEKIELVKIAWPPPGTCAKHKLAEYQTALVKKTATWELMQTSDPAKCLQ